MEEYQPWSREASPTPKDRKMSFNPVGTWTEPAFEEPVGAFEVPKWKRICTYTLDEMGYAGYRALS
jgi:hypothetical protein